MLSLILLLVSLVILGLVTLKGVLGGLRKGAFHSLVKLGALVLSVVISLVICLCLRGALVSLVDAVIPSDFAELGDILELIVQIPASLLLLGVFWLIFSIVRAIMLIPQKIICKFLPKTYEEFAQKTKRSADSTDAPSDSSAPPVDQPVADETMPMTATSDASIAEDAPINDAHTERQAAADQAVSSTETAEDTANAEEPTAVASAETAPEKDYGKLIWKLSGALCGALSSLLLLGAWLMPVSGLVTRSGEAVSRVTEVMAEKGYGKYSQTISDVADAIANAPLFTVTDFFYGKTVFEPLTTIQTDFGKINLTDELRTATDLSCEMMPVFIHLTQEGTVREGDTERLAASAEKLSESDFLLTVGTYAINYSGKEIEKSAEKESTQAKVSLQKELSAVMTDMTPSELPESIDTVIELVDVLADSPILEAITVKDKKLEASDLTDREAMREAFGILYDNDNTKGLIVPMVNLGTETVLLSMGAEPVYSDLDVNEISREEMLEEADHISDAAEGLAEFSDSVNAEGSELATYQMDAAGRALDELKESAIFGKQHGALVNSLSTAISDGEDDSVISALGDALTTTDSAENLLSSAQSVAVMNKELESGEKKGRENEKLVDAMDVLLNKTDPDDYDALKGVAGVHFTSASSKVDSATQAQMTEDYINALTVVSQQAEKDVPAEADAIQAIYDVTHSGSENAFAKISEEDTINALLASDVAHEMLSNLNEEGRDYGIRAKLTDENKEKISNAIDANDASADRKAVVATFFGVN